jgi:hypothetical protein
MRSSMAQDEVQDEAQVRHRRRSDSRCTIELSDQHMSGTSQVDDHFPNMHRRQHAQSYDTYLHTLQAAVVQALRLLQLHNGLQYTLPLGLQHSHGKHVRLDQFQHNQEMIHGH